MNCACIGCLSWAGGSVSVVDQRTQQFVLHRDCRVGWVSVGMGRNVECFFIFRLLPSSSPQQIFHLHSASSSVTSTTAMSSLTASMKLLLGLPRFVFPGSFILSIHHQYIYKLILFPPYMSKPPKSCHLCFALSLWCTHSWSCPFLSLLTRIVTSSTLPPPSPPTLFSLLPPSPTRITWERT